MELLLESNGGRKSSRRRRLFQLGLKIVVVILGLILVLIAGMWIFAANIVRQIEIAYPPEGKFVEVDGVRLHYVRSGEGRPVVFLHCGGCNLGYFTKTPLYPLVLQEYEAIFFDRYGCGYSDSSTEAYTTPTEQARLIHRALEELGGIYRPVLVGSSAGGAVAMAYALEYPDEISGIIEIGGWIYAEEESDALTRFFKLPVVWDIMANAVYPTLIYAFTSFNDEIPGPDPTPSHNFLIGPLRLMARPQSIRISRVQEEHFAPELQSLASRYDELELPIIYVAGSEDTPSLKQAEQLISEVKQAKLVRVEGAGHFVYFGRPEVVIQAIRDVWAAAEE